MAVFAGLVTASADDAAQITTGGATDLTAASVTMNTTGGSLWVGLRFLNVTIPRGSVVSAADIQLKHSAGGKNPNLDATISAQAADNPGTFTTGAGNIDTRTRTTASTIWTATLPSTPTYNVSPDIAAVIQEVNDRALWVSGNALVIVLQARSTSSGEFTMWDFPDANTEPLLDITYTLHAPPAPKVMDVLQAVTRASTR